MYIRVAFGLARHVHCHASIPQYHPLIHEIDELRISIVLLFPIIKLGNDNVYLSRYTPRGLLFDKGNVFFFTLVRQSIVSEFIYLSINT